MAYNYLEDHSDGVLSKLLETNCILEFLGRGDACILADLHSCTLSTGICVYKQHTAVMKDSKVHNCCV